MGIHGLLPFLKHYTTKKNIRDFSGKKIGVDAMCWMHRGAFACSEDLIAGKDTHRFIHFFIGMCETLHQQKIKPVIVFDGARLPAKLKEEQSRMDTREKYKNEALELLRKREAGERIDDHELAKKCQGAVRITNGMISRLMVALRELGITFIVSPYEADAQLAYLCRVGWVDVVISEDSDLLAYGCPSTLFKMDKYGDGDNVILPCLQPGAAVRNFCFTGSEDFENPQDECEEHGSERDVAGGVVEEHEAATQVEAVKDGAKQSERMRGNSGRGRCRRGTLRKRDRGTNDADVERANDDAVVEGADGHAQDAVVERANDAVVDGTTLAVPSAKAKAKRIPRGLTPSVAALDRWTPEKFTEFCVTLGCDYKENDTHVKGLGPKTAFRLMCRFKSAISMFRWLRREKTWANKFPLVDEEVFFFNYRRVVTVFWHHIVFDPRRGECVTLATAFPNSNREVPGIDVVRECGAPLVKEQAKLVARGELDPRTLKQREFEPLTPLERQNLDGRLQSTRKDLRQKENEHQRKVEAEAIMAAAAEKAKAAAEMQRSGAGGASARVDEVGVLGATSIEQNETDQQSQPREMRLGSSDLNAIFAARKAVEQEEAKNVCANSDTNTPPRTVGTPEATNTPSPTGPVQRFNPFARKRPADAAISGTSETSTLGADSCAVVSKRPRIIGGGAPLSRSGTSNVASQASKSDTPKSPAPRSLAAPRLHRLGGYAAMEAAVTVLSHRGIVELEPEVEMHDRSKLFHFMKVKPGVVAKAAKASAPAPKDSLKSWKARPWEATDQSADEAADRPFAVPINPLSMAATRGNPFKRLV